MAEVMAEAIAEGEDMVEDMMVEEGLRLSRNHQ